eukprot:Gregarina_sp_Poly_1__6590@NODE_3538_length_1026_cov_138_251303_g2246_i0_p1_GENE_NODE_3538_length_1026_cov_138_251303_g2246_i0NODE_3538_length_1026_cov_138_251303_g2246_i0_p1_ORF_typecomplete_len144_score20_58CutA1/PF03091_15/8_2e02CutA1/PF03091_15/0_0022PII/PF00543_22/0_004_NODE_3538_length_1026_cov_138_251303_g2246_i0444875
MKLVELAIIVKTNERRRVQIKEVTKLLIIVIMQKLYKFVFFSPPDHTEQVKNAIFEAAGGRIGKYDRCSFQVRGQGQFRPLEGSNPHIGRVNEITTVEEDMVEVLVAEAQIESVINALKKAHPYETPAWELIELRRPQMSELV